MAGRSKKDKWRRSVAALAALVIIPISVFLVLDAVFPFPFPGQAGDFAVAVTAEDGSPLRGFPDNKGVWRYPIGTEDVSPLYLEALINYEDRWFRRHPGVNPWSLLRAAGRWLYNGRPMSGGSTLTMQTARIFDPHEKNIPGKIKQIFRALQLEYHLTKDEILTLYLNYAPFGGTVEGVQAAGYAYLGKSVSELSHAEAALLAVLPQAPSRLRPDRHADRATRARDKVLRRMARFGIWTEKIVEEARIEKVEARFNPRPMNAPLLARRLKNRGGPAKPVKTTIDLTTQRVMADIVQRYVLATPPRTSAAALVVENKTMGVKAYVGSADFFNDTRYGHVDMIRARRSPGSTLKPFLYGFAMEEGLIHSESLLVDAPISFTGYRPGNFSKGFSGPVSASEALRRSLNIPAVDLLDRLGPELFDSRLRQGGLNLSYPRHASPNLSMILGGVGTTLEDLVSAYSALAREGKAGKLRYTAEEPLKERRLMQAGAAYIIRRILQEHKRSDLPGGRLTLARSRQVAWKTGTSYGFRDAWAIGVTDEYTVGVWIGRPDGTPSPGQYGRATAAPLLFSLVDALPRKYGPPPPAPDNVKKAVICWPLGTIPRGDNDPLCHQKRTAWLLDGAVPPTLPDRTDRYWQKNPVTILLNPLTGLRVDADCLIGTPVIREIARWPRAVEPWLSPHLRKISLIPNIDPGCKNSTSALPVNIRILDIEPGTVFRPQGAEIRLPMVTLQALGGQGRLFWMLNGELIGRTGIGRPHYYRFKRPGRYNLTVMDLAGNYDTVEIKVLGGNPDG